MDVLTYLFERPDGDIVEALFESSEVVAIGEYVDIDGLMCRRCVSPMTVKKPVDYHHKANTLDPWRPGAKKYAADGQPLFESKRDVDEFAARTGCTYGQG